MKLPNHERKKLISSLQKHSGQTRPDFEWGIPETVKYAYPNNKLGVTSNGSKVDCRKIHDIPRSFYHKFQNKFLLNILNQISSQKSHKLVGIKKDAVSLNENLHSDLAPKKASSMLDFGSENEIKKSPWWKVFRY